MSRSAIRRVRRGPVAGAVAVAFLGAGPAAWARAIPMPEVVSGLLPFRLSRNIGMTLGALRARARDARAVRVKYERLYDGRPRALDIVAAGAGQ